MSVRALFDGEGPASALGLEICQIVDARVPRRRYIHTIHCHFRRLALQGNVVDGKSSVLSGADALRND